MGAPLRVQDVSVRCGGGVYGAAARHAPSAMAVGWQCRARRGWRLIPPKKTRTSISPCTPRRPAHRLSSCPPSSDLHLLFFFFLPLAVRCPFSRAQRFDFSLSLSYWWEERDLDLLTGGEGDWKTGVWRRRSRIRQRRAPRARSPPAASARPAPTPATSGKEVGVVALQPPRFPCSFFTCWIVNSAA
jgi:hypothetical protein